MLGLCISMLVELNEKSIEMLSVSVCVCLLHEFHFGSHRVTGGKVVLLFNRFAFVKCCGCIACTCLRELVQSFGRSLARSHTHFYQCKIGIATSVNSLFYIVSMCLFTF